MSVMPHSDRAVFRLPWVSLAFPLLLFLAITPLATAGGAWIVLYAVPAAALLVVLLAHTRVQRETVRTLWLNGPAAIAWDDVDTLEFSGARWAVAVGHDGTRHRLPAVRPRDLPRLVAAAGGRLHLAAPREEPAGSLQPAPTVGAPTGVDEQSTAAGQPVEFAAGPSDANAS